MQIKETKVSPRSRGDMVVSGVEGQAIKHSQTRIIPSACVAYRIEMLELSKVPEIGPHKPVLL